MIDWRKWLRPGEPEQLEAIKADKAAGQRLAKQIRDRCRQRALYSERRACRPIKTGVEA